MSLDNNRMIVRCCYLGMFVQAMVINLTPLLFIPLKEQLGLSFEQVGRLVLINFLTQMLVDLICCALADRMNAKPLTIAANLLAGAGLWLFALSARWFDAPYNGLVLGTVVFSIGCGLLEVLLSPIFNAVPSQRKAAGMAVLHAFYPIGKVSVVLVTALALHFLGTSHWQWIMLAWSILPLINTVGFLMVTLPPFAAERERVTLRKLLRLRPFLMLAAAIGCAGAAELTIGQWASAFAEQGLGWPKLIADLAGFGMFGVGMIAGRLWVGFHEHDFDLGRLMITGALLSGATYVVISVCPSPALSLLMCAPAGLFVSMLWPGVISLSAARYPLAGASMFALLAATGDTGAAVAPWIVGVIADYVPEHLPWLGRIVPNLLTPQQVGLRAGLLVATIAPLGMAGLLWRLRDKSRNEPSATALTGPPIASGRL